MHEEFKEDIKAIRADVAEIKVHVAINTADLKTHIARTEASEKRIEYLERVLISLAAVAVLGGVIKLLIS